MNKIVFKNIIRFLALLLAQVFIFNKLNLGGSLVPMVYPLFILLLPIELSSTFVLLISFMMGLSLDLFVGSLGMHASAATFMAFLRPASFKLISSKRYFEPKINIGINDLGLTWFIKYSAFLVFAHHLFFFCVETFNFNLIFPTIIHIILNTILSVVIIVVIDILFKPKAKK